MCILQTQNLKKYYGSGETAVKALDGVDLSVPDGEFAAIVGTSGSGKSTLLHLLGGLDRPTDGKVIVAGKDIFSLDDNALTIFRRRKIGFIFQSYGYMKNPDGSKSWVVDEETAAVVRRIFSLTLEGLGSHQIADILASERILTPINYWLSKGINRGGKKSMPNPYYWRSSVIIKMLEKQEYCGDLVNFKTYSKSYKNKRRIINDRENWVVFKDVHEPIVDRSVWETIQERRSRKTRKKQKTYGEKNMFAGLLVCADCGSNLWYHFNQANPEIEYFNCSGYNKGKRKICNSTHYIRVDFLEKVVLGEIRRLTKLATQYESEFAKIVMGHSIKAAEQERQFKQKELHTLNARNDELDNLFEHIYEDI